MRSECYRKGIGYLLGRRYSLPFAKIMRTNAELSDCRPSINRIKEKVQLRDFISVWA